MLGPPRHRLVDRSVAAPPAVRAPQPRPLGAAPRRLPDDPLRRPSAAASPRPRPHHRVGRDRVVHRPRPDRLAGRRARAALGLAGLVRGLGRRRPDGARLRPRVRRHRRAVVAEPAHPGRLRGPSFRLRRARRARLGAVRPVPVVRLAPGQATAQHPPGRGRGRAVPHARAAGRDVRRGAAHRGPLRRLRTVRSRRRAHRRPVVRPATASGHEARRRPDSATIGGRSRTPSATSHGPRSCSRPWSR